MILAAKQNICFYNIKIRTLLQLVLWFPFSYTSYLSYSNYVLYYKYSKCYGDLCIGYGKILFLLSKDHLLPLWWRPFKNRKENGCIRKCITGLIQSDKFGAIAMWISLLFLNIQFCFRKEESKWDGWNS